MRKRSITMLLLTGLCAGVVGCDSQASEQAEAQRHLDAALTKLGRANAGYVAEADAGDVPLLAYRQKTMDAAYADLNQVMALNAPYQKMQAMRLGAEIDTSAARYAARSAAVENAALEGRATVLLGYLSAMEGADARADALQPQTAEQIAKLQAEIQTQRDKQQALTAQIDELEQQFQAVSAEVAQFRSRADEGNAQAQKLRDQAFVASGDAMYDLQDQAAELERQAAVESASAEQRQVIADDLAAKLALDRVQLDTVQKLLAELTKQVQNTQADTERFADESQAATEASAAAAQTLADEYQKITGVYAEAIEKPLKQAAEKVDSALDALKQASGMPEARAESESIKLQLLAAYVDQVHITTSHAAYAREMAGLTEAVLQSVSRIGVGDAQLYADKLSALTDAEVALREKAGEMIETGLALAEELAPEGATAEDGKTTAIALKQKQRLNTYKTERLASGS